MTREERKEYNFWLKRRLVDGRIEKQCSSCNNWLEENENNFYMMNKSKPEKGFSSECKKCVIKRSDKNRSEKYDDYYREYNRQLYLKDPEKFIENDKRHRIQFPEKHKAKDRNWRQRNPEKCREYSKLHRNHDITEPEWRNCLNVFDNQCAYCGLPYKKHIIKRNGKNIIMKLHRDHVDDNGYNDLRNAVPSCMSCNSSKHESDMEEWYKKQEFYNEDKYNKIIWWVTEGYKKYIEDKPPYRIIRKQNEGLKTFHAELWSVDEQRNMIECIHIANKKKDIQKWIESLRN